VSCHACSRAENFNVAESLAGFADESSSGVETFDDEPDYQQPYGARRPAPLIRMLTK
jgi:hypothetical protein